MPGYGLQGASSALQKNRKAAATPFRRNWRRESESNMNKSIITFLGIVILIATFVIGGLTGILFVGDLDRVDIPEYNYELWKQIEQSDYEYVDLEEFGSDRWQRVCFLGPYNGDSSSALGFSWEITDFTNTLSSDGHNVLIFATDSEVVDFIIQSRSHGDFWEMSGKCLDRKNSKLLRNKNNASFIKQ